MYEIALVYNLLLRRRAGCSVSPYQSLVLLLSLGYRPTTRQANKLVGQLKAVRKSSIGSSVDNRR